MSAMKNLSQMIDKHDADVKKIREEIRDFKKSRLREVFFSATLGIFLARGTLDLFEGSRVTPTTLTSACLVFFVNFLMLLIRQHREIH